jgi:esterase
MLRRALICCIAFVVVVCPGVMARMWELPPDVKTLQVNGYEMAYLERGTGVPVVLVHGTVSDYRYWAGQMEPFGERLRTIAVSLRHAYPERWNGEGEDASVRQHAHDLAAFITGLRANPVHVVGHSRGGDVVLLMASAHPELLRSVILMDPAPLEALLPQTPQATAEAEKRRSFVSAALERLQQGDIEGGLERFIDGVSVPGAWQKMPDPQKQTMRDNAWSIKSLLTDAKEPFTCAAAGNITVPVLRVTGENSPRPYGVMMEALTPCLKQHEKVTIPNAAHAMNRANAQAFNAAVLEFLAKH